MASWNVSLKMIILYILEWRDRGYFILEWRDRVRTCSSCHFPIVF